jgi:hypothetical protein
MITYKQVTKKQESNLTISTKMDGYPPMATARLNGTTVMVIRRWSNGVYKYIDNGKIRSIKNLNQKFTDFKYLN